MYEKLKIKTIAISDFSSVTKTPVGLMLATGLVEKLYEVLLIDTDYRIDLAIYFIYEPEEEDMSSLYHFFKAVIRELPEALASWDESDFLAY